MEKLSVVEAKKKELLKLSKKKGYITAESLNTIFEDNSITSEEIDELSAVKLARDIKNKIESEMQYPGTVKVTLIRETRVIEEAK